MNFSVPESMQPNLHPQIDASLHFYSIIVQEQGPDLVFSGVTLELKVQVTLRAATDCEKEREREQMQ